LVKTFIGMGAILFSYSRIGSQCIVGGETLVTQRKVIPDKSMVYGNPFQIVCSLRQNEIDGVYHDVLEYRDLGREYKKLQEMMNQEE
jgi:carbonic anhydrase/acetyltransferase-like protein (isoleucine patch superfamily)